VPERANEWREAGGFRSGERAELGGSHGVIMRAAVVGSVGTHCPGCGDTDSKAVAGSISSPL
jgi:hypothetical protein